MAAAEVVVAGVSEVKVVSGSAVVSGNVSGSVKTVSDNASVSGGFSDGVEAAAVSVSISFDVSVKTEVSLVTPGVSEAVSAVETDASADSDKLFDVPSAESGAEAQAADKTEITADKITAMGFLNFLHIAVNPFLIYVVNQRNKMHGKSKELILLLRLRNFFKFRCNIRIVRRV